MLGNDEISGVTSRVLSASPRRVAVDAWEGSMEDGSSELGLIRLIEAKSKHWEPYGNIR